jgi:hypothetical protein
MNRRFSYEVEREIGKFGVKNGGVKVEEIKSKVDGVRYFLFEPYARFGPYTEYGVVLDEEVVREMMRSIRAALL